MSQFITVVANNGTHGALHRAGRRFENGVRWRFEVVKNERVVGKVRNRHTNELEDKELPPDPKAPFDKNGEPSMERICQAGFDLIKGDPRISWNGGDEDEQGAATAIVAALRKQLADAQAELSDAKVTVADLQNQVNSAKAGGAGGKAREPKESEGDKPAKGDAAKAGGAGGKARE